MSTETEPRRAHHAPHTFPPSTPEERREYLYQWAKESAQKNEPQTVKKAQQQLRDTFGVTTGTANVAAILKRAAEEARGQRPVTKPIATDAMPLNLAELEKGMRAAGVQLIELLEEGKGLKIQFFNP